MTSPIFSHKEKFGLYLVYVLIATMVIAVALCMLALTTDVFGSDNDSEGGKGLIVHVTISTNLVSQPVYLDTFQHGQFVVGHDSYMDNGVTEIVSTYDKGEIDTGEFEICATAQEGMKKCAIGYNREEKEPEYVSIEMYSDNTPQPVQEEQPTQDQSQAQSSNNENENNNALSQSQETTIIICKDGDCKPAQ